MLVVSPVDDYELPADHKPLMTVCYHPFAIVIYMVRVGLVLGINTV